MAVTSSGTATVTLPTEEQILITREFDAPKHLVWKAFTTPELVRRWWNAKRGEMTVAEIDLRAGGKWRYVDGDRRRDRGRLPRRVPGGRPRTSGSSRPRPTRACPRESPRRTRRRSTRRPSPRRTGARPSRSSCRRGARSRGTRSSSPGWRPGCRTRSTFSRRSPSRSVSPYARGHRERCARWPARRRRLQTYASRASSGRGTLVGASASTKSGAYLIFPA